MAEHLDTTVPGARTGAFPSLQGLFRGDDYPPDALIRNQQGSVRVKVSIDDHGAVRDCIVTGSSGIASLDTQTCRVIWMRGKFEPVRDARGKRVATAIDQKITWRIADLPVPSTPWFVRSVTDFAAGKPPTCRVEAEGFARNMPGVAKACGEMGAVPAGAFSLPNARVEFIVEEGFAVGAKPASRMTPGDQLAGKELVKVEIDPAGNLTSCQVVENAGSMPRGFPGLCTEVSRRYVPQRSATGAPVPFTAYYLVAGYLHVEKVA